MVKNPSRLIRPIHPMPNSIRKALTDCDLMNSYLSRPPYQRNDYVGWITRAKRVETREKRLEQMLSELESKDRYMGMAYRAKYVK